MSAFRSNSLHLVATEAKNRLWSQTEVAHDRNPGFDNMSDDLFIAGDSFELDGARPGANQCLDSLHSRIDTSPVRAEWKICHDKGFRTDAAGCGHMRSHHINGGKNSALESIQDHGYTVTHKQAIDTGLESDSGKDRIIDAKHRNFSPILFCFPEIGNRMECGAWLIEFRSREIDERARNRASS